MSLVAVLTLAAGMLALAVPANAGTPAGKKYEIDMLGAHINSPFDLNFFATDCVSFSKSGSVACFPLTFNDCGPVTITGEEGSVVHFEVELRAKIGAPGAWLFEGPITLVGTVDRFGAGSALSAVGNGRLRSNVIPLPRTRTNLSLHGLEGCSAMTITTTTTLKPEQTWVRKR